MSSVAMAELIPTVIPQGKRAAVSPEKKSVDPSKLTFDRMIELATNIFSLTQAHTRWMLGGLGISVLFALIGAMADWPTQYLVDWATHKDTATAHVPYWEFMRTAALYFVIVNGLNVVLPGLQKIANAIVQTLVRETVSMNAITDALRRRGTKLPSDMAPRLQQARDHFAEGICTVLNDAPFYVRGVLILVFFVLYKSWTVPVFALVAVGGTVLAGVITYVSGVHISRLYDKKQNAGVKLSALEIKLFAHLNRTQERHERPLILTLVCGKTVIRERMVPDAARSLEILRGAWKDYQRAFVTAEVLLLAINTFVCDMLLESTKVVCALILYGYVHEEIITAGQALVLFGLVGKAAEPFLLYRPLQKRLMEIAIYVDWLKKLQFVK